jgi:hypothetical protein
MATIQIDGTYTYANNTKNLKIGDTIILKPNPNNRVNSEAIGAYTKDGLKIGYIPLKIHQININAKYTVSHIKLLQGNPVLHITMEYENSSIINIEPEFIKKIKYNNQIIKSDLDNELKSFSRYLLRAGNQIKKLGITYQDDNFINILIHADNQPNLYYTVSKKYYEENIFKYDEFYNYKLIPKCIYIPFQIHRLEKYVEINYKYIDKLLKSKKINQLLKNYDSEINFMDFYTEQKLSQTLFYNLDSSHKNNLIKLYLQYLISNNEYYNPNNYFKLINTNYSINFNYDYLAELKELLGYIKLGGLCYNHQYKSYCYIDLYNDDSIIEISLNNLNENKMEYLLKLLISNKNNFYLINPLTSEIKLLSIDDDIKEKFNSLF